ncbi:relaxase/mobilization nuclease domain-containing protein [Pontibacter akesuensis]|uniref:Relaxase/Mobilisation nuclease domain-containing protein n=1 Tax=Pontibacter akesuensis TaxID=388950 RepID=A0A1I7KPG3_9BACT|nr:relaxase/mobilization nuclease domain-containing protein [Pontibacter akesuensis]GHA81673.1 mobilization protein [Pontibacter akesuensis]SFU99332.1 Relaxase/Mobilisation nuclease domain-containing protein [Pontibacter akesuensis]
MIVKILSSAGTFAGVGYNEDKVEKGTAELLVAENFGMLQPVGGALGNADYTSYLQSWSKSESNAQRVRQPQFHAVLSCEGREKDASELVGIAAQYLQKMGYGENPHLIYFHSDTQNNHVHIVSTRVNREGRKIDDSFERTRSQKVLKEIMLQDMGTEIRAHVAKAMAYSFSTPAQFRLLLELEGVKVKETPTQLELVKYGTLISAVDKDTINKKISAYAAPDERIRQLRALLAKYRPGLSAGEFKAFLKGKFGVEIIYHQAKGQDTPYGYSVIDHAQKQVLKGSQLMKLSELLSPVSRSQQLGAAEAVVKKVSKSNSQIPFSAFKKELAALGFTVSKSGKVKRKGEKEAVLQVEPERMRALHYNERLRQANKYVITSETDIRILTHAFHLKPGSLKVDGPADRAPRRYTADRLNSMLANGHTLPAIFERNEWSLARSGGKYHLIDRRDREIYPMNKLTSQKLDFGGIPALNTDKAIAPESARRLEHRSAPVGGMLELIAELLLSNSQRENKQSERRKKRKRKR